MKLNYPKPLNKGATFGVVAPGSPPTEAEKIIRGVQYLESRGCRVIVGEGVYQTDGYLSGTDEVRANDINRFFAQGDVDAIICTRGGYGCTRLLEMLDYQVIANNHKPLIGFSDITALHMALLTQSALVSFAGPMLAVEMQTQMPPSTEQSFWKMLEGTAPENVYTVEKVSQCGYESSGNAKGMLIGGNMAVFMSLFGTRYVPEPEGCILLLEDIGEPVYKIDRMFSQLLNSGYLERLSGVILGSFTSIPKDAPNRRLSTVVREYLEPLQIPVLDGFPFGHTALKLTLPIGAEIEMDVDSRSIRFRRSGFGK